MEPRQFIRSLKTVRPVSYPKPAEFAPIYLRLFLILSPHLYFGMHNAAALNS
jgi:hypothetical protein